MTGISLNRPSLFNCRMTAKPSSPGMRMSSRMRSGGCSVAWGRASRQEAKARQSCCRSKMDRAMVRLNALSSMTKTRRAVWPFAPRRACLFCGRGKSARGCGRKRRSPCRPRREVRRAFMRQSDTPCGGAIRVWREASRRSPRGGPAGSERSRGRSRSPRGSRAVRRRLVRSGRNLLQDANHARFFRATRQTQAGLQRGLGHCPGAHSRMQPGFDFQRQDEGKAADILGVPDFRKIFRVRGLDLFRTRGHAPRRDGCLPGGRRGGSAGNCVRKTGGCGRKTAACGSGPPGWKIAMARGPGTNRTRTRRPERRSGGNRPEWQAGAALLLKPEGIAGRSRVSRRGWKPRFPRSSRGFPETRPRYGDRTGSLFLRG